MIGRSRLIAAMLILATLGSGLSAQTDLAREITARFDVLLLRDGVALRPKTPIRGTSSIEVSGGGIAVDGAPVTGAELRTRIGSDADAVIQLSYLDGARLRALFAPTGPAAGAPPATGAAPSDVAAPSAGTPPPPPEPVEASPVDRDRQSGRRGQDRDDMVRIGASITVNEQDDVDGDVVAVGGSVHVNGHVRGDVVAVMGSVDLGPTSIVEGNVAIVGGSLNRADGARVDGRIQQVGWGAMSGTWVGRGSSWSRWFNRDGGAIFGLFSVVARGVVVSLLAMLVVLLAQGLVEKVGAQAEREPLKAGTIGLLSQLLFLPLIIVTVVVLFVTIVLIPLVALVPFVILGLIAAALVGFTSVAKRVGEAAAQRFNWPAPSAYLATLIGIATILSPMVLARLALAAGGTGVSFLWHFVAFVGFCVEYVAWTVGFGAVALNRFGGRALFKSGSQPSTPIEG